MSNLTDIKDALKLAVKNGDDTYSIVCTVESVDTTRKTCVCEPVSGGAELMGVKLMAQNKTGFYIIPKINSQVIVTITPEYVAYVGMFSEVDEIQLNGDNYDGVPIVGNLVQKLNNLENAFNQFVALYNAHTHVETSTNTLVPSTLNTNILTPTTTAMLKNNTVKHGNGI